MKKFFTFSLTHDAFLKRRQKPKGESMKTSLTVLLAGVAAIGIASEGFSAGGHHKESRHEKSHNKTILSYGEFESMPAAGEMDIGGKALMVRTAGEGTSVDVFLSGLGEEPEYPAHVHDLPCDQGGGAHYKIDTGVAGTVAENEIWPTVAANPNGTGLGGAETDHVARPDAQSVVVHNPADGSRIACADLFPNAGAIVTKGAFEDWSGTCGITGRAKMVRRAIGITKVTVHIKGLAPNATYKTHVHNLPCDIENGGGHYKIDPSAVGAVESNEIWPTVTTDEDGKGRGVAIVDHIARPEGQSVVIHDPADGSRIACADLN